MKKLYSIIFFAFIFLIHFFFVSSIRASSFDFQLVPKTTKSGSSEGYYSKIPLVPLSVQKGKLNFLKQNGWDYISFQGDYDEITGELKGVFTGATANNSPNSGAFYYCEFSAEIKKDQKTTTLKYYPIHGTAETLNHCYSQVVFDFEKNRRAPKDDWWPDNLAFEIQPLNSNNLEDSGTRFSDIYGEVEILLPTGYDDSGEPIFEDEEGWNHAKVDMELPYGAKLRLKERSGIILAIPGSEPYELKTPENLYPYGEAIIILPTKQKKDSLFKLLSGQLYNNVKKILKDNTMDIEMGQAVAGIKGTTFILEENGKKSTLKVLDGKVEFKSKITNKSELVKAGEVIVADKTGLGEKKSFEIASEKNKWSYKKPKAYQILFKLNNKTVYLWLLVGVILVIGVIIIWRLKSKK
ncbi:MAG: FecR family protein [Candidatus Omnitrophica bacterium]|nr:FecR family protein [Candidatus Omnitrophota bacterium]